MNIFTCIEAKLNAISRKKTNGLTLFTGFNATNVNIVINKNIDFTCMFEFFERTLVTNRTNNMKRDL